MSAFFQGLPGSVLAADMSGCGPAAGAGERRAPRGFGYYANAMTTTSVDRVEDPRPRLKEVGAPVLVVRLECDRLRWEVAREYRSVFPEATLVVVDGADHAVESSRLGLYADLIRTFLIGEPLPVEPYVGDERPGRQGHPVAERSFCRPPSSARSPKFVGRRFRNPSRRMGHEA